MLSQDSGSFFLASLDSLLCLGLYLYGVFASVLPLPNPVDRHMGNLSRLVWLPCYLLHDMLEILPTMRLGHHVLLMFTALKSDLAGGVLLVWGLFHERRLLVNVHTSMA